MDINGLLNTFVSFYLPYLCTMDPLLLSKDLLPGKSPETRELHHFLKKHTFIPDIQTICSIDILLLS